MRLPVERTVPADFALQLSSHPGLELAKVINHLAGFFRLAQRQIDLCQPIPAVWTHRLQRRIFFQCLPGFVKLLLMHQHQGQTIPGPIHRGIELGSFFK